MKYSCSIHRILSAMAVSGLIAVAQMPAQAQQSQSAQGQRGLLDVLNPPARPGAAQPTEIAPNMPPGMDAATLERLRSSYATGGGGAPLISGASGPDPRLQRDPRFPGGAGTSPMLFGGASERNDFQLFIQQSTGASLPLYGAELFRNVPTTYAPIDNVPVTPDYVIGPGDEVMIRAWGQIDIDFRAIVDRNGIINVPRVGNIQVAGIKYQNLSEYLRTALSRVFRNFELTASLGQLRSVQIFVTGQARRPGTYTVSSLSTLVNAVFAAGGPLSTGTMRRVQLKRGNAVVTEFDIYDLLVDGDKSKDAQLLPGDVIHFPAAGPLVAVMGAVNSAAVYEMKSSANVADLLKWAGGLSTPAMGQRVTVERIDQRSVRKVDEYTMDAAGLAKPLRDGDLVTVYAITPRFDNAVTLRGNVAQPARFPWREGMRVKDLIPDREALLTRDYWQRRNELEQPLAVDGGAPEPGQRTLGGGNPRPTQLGRPTGEVNWDYAVIERRNPQDLSTTLVPFDLGKAVLSNDPAQNLVLNPGDVVVVFSKEDVRVSEEKRVRYVRLEGEFNTSGVYAVAPGETLRQLVTRVGGIASNAYLFGAEFSRQSTRIDQEKRYQEAMNRMEIDVQRQIALSAANAISPEDVNSLKASAASQLALIQRLRQLRPSGRIVLALPETPQLGDLPDLKLEDGDRFYVPMRPAVVGVFGAVYNESSSFLYRTGNKVSDYVTQAGGTTRFADDGSMYVARADGSIFSQRQRGFFGMLSGIGNERVMPGDTIIVPEELDRTTFIKNLKDWTQIFFQFGLGAAALKVIRE